MPNAGALTVLQNNELFRDVARPVLQQLSEICQNREFAKGDMVCMQGEVGDSLYGVISGELRISAQTAEGDEMHLNVIGAGEVIGEIALLDGGERSASAVATQSSVLFSLGREPFLELLEKERGLASHLLKLLCQRIRWTSEIVEDVVFRAVPIRLARRVAILAKLHGESRPEGTLLRLSQQDLAQFLNVSRQIVNANLQEWQREGLVKLGRGTILVQDFSGLEAVSVEST